MLCSQCEQPLALGADRCETCQAPAGPAPCPVCQTALFGKEAFCPRCGSMLSRQADPLTAKHLQILKAYLPEKSIGRIFSSDTGVISERRYAAVVFADVSGFTAMSESMDPEAVVEIMNGVFEGMVRAVHHFDGTVDKFIGDAVLAVFGAPVAHDNDPERAILAALEMRAAVKDYSEQSGRSLSLSIGINAGPLVAGTVGGDGRLNYTVMGDTVNVAQRLESAAHSGQVLATQEVVQRTKGSARFRPLAPIRVKGKRNPLDVWEARDVRVRTDPNKAQQTLIGRDLPLQTLESFISNPATDRGLVTGCPGVGRSQLLLTLAARREKAGVETHLAACPRYTDASYGGLVTELVARLLRVRLDQGSGAVADGLKKLQELGLSELEASLLLAGATRGEVPTLESDAEQIDRSRIAAFSRTVALAARGAPLLIVFEDLQWATPSDIVDLKLILNQAAPPGVTYLASMRDSALAKLGALPSCQRLCLENFDLETTRHLICMFLKLPLLDDRSAERMYRLSAGNPRMVRELIDTWVDQGLIFKTHQRWIVSPKILEAPPPASLDALITARLDELDEDALRFLRTAAVTGSRFEAETVRRIAGLHVDLDWAVSELLDRGLIMADPTKGWMFRFKQPRYQHVAAAGLSDKERRPLHHRTAAYLEETEDRRDPRIARLIAEHYADGFDHEKAARALVHAARCAASAYQLDNAIELLERLLKLATPRGYRNYDLSRCEQEVDEALYRLGVAYMQRGQLDEAEDRFQWSYGRARQFFQGNFRVWSLIGLAQVHARTSRTDKAREHLETAAADSEGMRDFALVAISLLERARLGIAEERYDEALEILTKTAVTLEKASESDLAALPLPLSNAHLRFETGAAHAGRGNAVEAAHCFQEALAAANAGGDLQVAARASLALARVEVNRGKGPAAQGLTRAAIEAFRKSGDRLGEAGAQHQLGLIDLSMLDLGAARKDLTQADLIFAELNHEEGRVVVGRAMNRLQAQAAAE